MSKDHDYFQLWYVEPLRALEKLPNGQGGFMALGTACFLYERYANAFLKSQHAKPDKQHILGQISSDFGVDPETARAFWDVIRDGILHQGMPLQKKNLPAWGFHDSYPVMALDNVNGRPYLKVQPWKFMAKVLHLWEDHFDLLQSSDSFPWATIGPVPA